MNVDHMRSALLSEPKNRSIERERLCAALSAPPEDERVGVAEPPTCRPEYAPAPIEKRPGRGQDLDPFLGPHPGARVPCRDETSPILNQRDRLRKNLARNEERVGRCGRFAGPLVKHVGLREEGIKEAGIRDLHAVTHRGIGRVVGSPADLRPRRSEGSPSQCRGQAVALLRSAPCLLPRFLPTRDRSCGLAAPGHCPSVVPWRACVYGM